VHIRSSIPWPLVALCLHACGGAPPAPTTAAVPASSSSGASGTGNFAVSGLRGTLSSLEIQGALEPKLPRMLRCVQQRRAELEPLAGRLALAFHVATDGSVVAVHPSDSTLGDRDTERCVLEVAASTHFPPPHGGEADFSWPLEIDADEDVRQPVALSADSARAKIGTQGDVLLAECGGSQVVVTMYVQPDGSVAAAGVAAPDGATGPQLDCIARGVRGWTFQSPGSYVGKLSFVLP